MVLNALMKEEMGDRYEAGPKLGDIFENGLNGDAQGDGGEESLEEQKKIKEIFESRDTGVMYVEDLTSAFYFALTREIPVHAPFDDEHLDALRMFLEIINKVTQCHLLLKLKRIDVF